MTNQNVAKPKITVDRLKELVTYDPQSGVFTANFRLSPTAGAGDILGTLTGGYIIIQLDRILYRSHRLAWLYMTGQVPSKMIDHINGVRSDNRWDNLRQASPAENRQNGFNPVRKNTTGMLGVSVAGKRFQAIITKDRKRIRVGRFDTAQEAHEAYLEAKKVYHPFRTVY